MLAEGGTERSTVNNHCRREDYGQTSPSLQRGGLEILRCILPRRHDQTPRLEELKPQHRSSSPQSSSSSLHMAVPMSFMLSVLPPNINRIPTAGLPTSPPLRHLAKPLDHFRMPAKHCPNEQSGAGMIAWNAPRRPGPLLTST